MGIPEAKNAISPLEQTNFTKLNGSKNQSITKPVSTDSITGEVLVRRATGKARVRKGQSQEEYEKQLHEYFVTEGGPIVIEPGYLESIETFDTLLGQSDLTNKQSRLRLLAFPQRFYYKREYQACIDTATKYLDKIEKVPKYKRELDELEYLISRSQQKLD